MLFYEFGSCYEPQPLFPVAKCVDPTGDGHESQCDPQRLDGERVGLDPQLLGILIKWIAKDIDKQLFAKWTWGF